MELKVSRLRELETVFLKWFEQRLLDSTACSLGEVFACSSQLLSCLRGLLLASHALAAASEQAGNMRCWRFANDVSNAATQSAARFPSACPDAEMADGVRVLAAQLRQLAFGSGAPVNPSNASLGKPLQAVKAAVVGVEGAAGALAACVVRWRPALAHLSGLKAELREPIAAFLRDVDAHYPPAGSSSALVPLGGGGGGFGS